MTSARFCAIAFLWALTLMLPGCGGSKASNASSSSSPASGTNVQAITVNAGPTGNYANGLFTSVTVCAPGTSNCQTVSGVLVDTGSYGLRVLSSALKLSLPQQNDSGGNPVVECAQFVLGITWGPVKTAEIKLGGEQANSVPVEVIGDPAYSTVPAGCSGHGTPQQTLAALGANGILGVGSFIADCGSACAASGSGNPGFYYGCPTASSCQIIAEPVSQQVQNPVAFFAADNNGVMVQLPAVSASTASVSGSLVFGIGTQSNNSLGGAKVFKLDNFGNFTTTYKSKAYPGFLDTGSNAYFFLDSATTGITDCPSQENGFYCPSSPASVSATNTGANSTSSNVSFTVDNAATLFANATDSVFPTLAGPNAGAFDWGLPFFFGRNVFTAIETKSTPGGTGPFWAY